MKGQAFLVDALFAGLWAIAIIVMISSVGRDSSNFAQLEVFGNDILLVGSEVGWWKDSWIENSTVSLNVVLNDLSLSGTCFRVEFRQNDSVKLAAQPFPLCEEAKDVSSSAVFFPTENLEIRWVGWYV